VSPRSFGHIVRRGAARKHVHRKLSLNRCGCASRTSALRPRASIRWYKRGRGRQWPICFGIQEYAIFWLRDSDDRVRPRGRRTALDELGQNDALAALRVEAVDFSRLPIDFAHRSPAASEPRKPVHRNSKNASKSRPAASRNFVSSAALNGWAPCSAESPGRPSGRTGFFASISHSMA